MNLTFQLMNDSYSWIDISAWVVEEDFSDWIKTKIKGDGFFDWAMEPLKIPVFKLLYDGPELATNRRCRVYRSELDLPLIDGYIDEIDDEFETRPVLTIQPVGLLSKKAMAGTLQEDGSYLFDTRTAAGAMELNTVIAYLIANMSTNMPEGHSPIWFTSTVTTGENLISAYYGDVPTEWFDGDRYPMYEAQIGWENMYSIRQRSGLHYATRAVIDLDSGLPIYYRVREIRENDHGNEFIVQLDEIQEYSAVTGNNAGLPDADIQEWVADNGLQFVSQNGCIRLGGSFWSLLFSPSQWHFVRFRDVFAEHRIPAVLQDKTVAEVLKLWAILTNHWFGFDGERLLFIARSDAREDISIPEEQIKLRKQKRKRYEDINIEIPQLKMVGSEIEEQGVGLSNNHIMAIQRFYRQLWEIAFLQSDMTIGNYPVELDLSLLGVDPTHGHIIQLDYATQENMIKTVTVKEN